MLHYYSFLLFCYCMWLLLNSTQSITRISNLMSPCVFRLANLKNLSFFSFLFPQSQLYMHLTNYSVNKHNENFERDETVDKGSKRSISWFTEFLRSNDYDVAKFWGDISVRRCFTEPHIHSFSSIYLVFALPFLRLTVLV